LRNPGYGGAAWGLYIAFDVIFSGVSFAGIVLTAVCRVFSIQALRPITRMAPLMSIIAIMAGGGTVVADLGRPIDGLMKLPYLARASSPFYGTFTMVASGYLFSSVVYFILDGRADAARLATTTRPPLSLLYRLWGAGYRDTLDERLRHQRATLWLSLGIIPLLFMATSTLGFVFGIQVGRPGWYSALQAPAFIAMAGLAGTGMLVLLAVTARKFFAAPIPDATIGWLGNTLCVLAFICLYFTIVDELTVGYGGPAVDRAVIHEIVAGHFAVFFWGFVASLIATLFIPLVLYIRGRVSVGWIGVAAAFATFAAANKRLLIVVPSQTHGSLIALGTGNYAPSWVEFGVTGGLIGIAMLMAVLAVRVIPLVPRVPVSDGRKSMRPQFEWRRSAATLGTIVVALCVGAIGLADSFRLFSGRELDSKIPFGPSLCALGIMMLFASAGIYELFPGRVSEKRI
jgi:molybdopterin-containing oxidoreductase family membrane subunit